MKNILFFIALSAMVISCNQPKESSLPKTKQVDMAFGIDASEYQDKIDWATVATQTTHTPVEFAIIRSTMGKDRVDKKFKYNWESAKKQGIIVGAYHYYDPNESSLKQATNYLKTINLQPGDLIPIVDIERLSKIQSNKRLCLGLKRWLKKVEGHFKVRPMIYTGHSFFNDYLCKEFAEYPLWIAAYSERRRRDTLVLNAKIHQFSEKIKMPGIRKNTVDGNSMRRENLATILMK